MKKIILLIAVSAILLLGVVEVNAQGFQANGEKNIDYKPLPNGDGLMQRLRNRICDTLGICQGGVNLTTITGELTFDGINFYIDDVELHFGPDWFIESAESSVDYDGNVQSIEIISAEKKCKLNFFIRFVVNQMGYFPLVEVLRVFLKKGKHGALVLI